MTRARRPICPDCMHQQCLAAGATHELIDAARYFADLPVSETSPCHIGICTMEQCQSCSRVLRLRRAIQGAEEEAS